MFAQTLPNVNVFSQSATIKSKEKSTASHKKPLKLHSADMAYLLVLRWFFKKGLKCYLTKEQWPEWLVRFGGKACHYRKQKARWAKMRALSFVRTEYYQGNRNKEMDHFITMAGLEAVDNFEKALRSKIKNGPSKNKKRPLKKQKTAPPLSHVQLSKNKHDKNLKILEKENDPEKVFSYKRLMDVGFYPEVALQAIRKYKRVEIYQAYNLAKEKNVDNKGAYMAGILKKLSEAREKANERR